MPSKEFTFDITTERIRRIGQELSNSSKITVSHFGTDEATAFLLLHADQLSEKLNETLREFIKDRLK